MQADLVNLATSGSLGETFDRASKPLSQTLFAI